MRKTHDESRFNEKAVRQPLKELAQQVIDRHAIDAERACQESGAGATLSPIQEAARQQVLSQLAANPSVRRAFINRFEANGTMVISLGIRGAGTGELLVPAERLNQSSLDDFSALLSIFEARHG